MSGYRIEECIEAFGRLGRAIREYQQVIIAKFRPMETRLSKMEVMNLHSKANAEGKALLEKIFGKEEFNQRPIGVWCCEGTGRKLVAREEWNAALFPLGVVVVTEDMAFIIAPHNTVVAQWGVPKVELKKLLVTDPRCTEDKDGSLHTLNIMQSHCGKRYIDPDGDAQYDFEGAPAAEFCLNYSHHTMRAGSWSLPTVKQLQAMAENIKEINACFMVMGCPTLPMGWYWSSIEKDEFCAWRVVMYDGDSGSYDKNYPYYVRAVSAFQI